MVRRQSGPLWSRLRGEFSPSVTIFRSGAPGSSIEIYVMKIAAALFLLSFSLLAQPKPADDEIVWLDNYKEALKEAKATGKPIFLEYRCEP